MSNKVWTVQMVVTDRGDDKGHYLNKSQLKQAITPKVLLDGLSVSQIQVVDEERAKKLGQYTDKIKGFNLLQPFIDKLMAESNARALEANRLGIPLTHTVTFNVYPNEHTNGCFVILMHQSKESATEDCVAILKELAKLKLHIPMFLHLNKIKQAWCS